MTYKRNEFRNYYIARGGQSNGANNYRWSLDRLEEQTGDLDRKIEQLGHAGMMEWARSERSGIFEGRYASSARSALKLYLKFLLDDGDVDEDEDVVQAVEVAEEIVENKQAKLAIYRYENELQVAVRRNIGDLEPGLTVADGGYERSVDTGRTDIVARTADGKTVVIELKVGECPKGALEQVLGYTQDIEEISGEPVTALLIAGSFPDRIRAAAKRVAGLKLLTYSTKIEFHSEV